MSEGSASQINKDSSQTSGRKFFLAGPRPAKQFCGQTLRFAAFWVAVFQLVTGILFCLYGIFYLLSNLAKTDFLIVVGSVALDILQLTAGLNGLRCTVQKVVKEGLNERLMERLIVWSWLSGLMTLLCVMVIIYSCKEVYILTIVISILFTPLYALCAYIVWSYKEDAMVQLPEYVGHWTKTNNRANEAMKQLKLEADLDGGNSNNKDNSGQQKPVWNPPNQNQSSSFVDNENDMLLEEGNKPTWQPVTTQGAYGQPLI